MTGFGLALWSHGVVKAGYRLDEWEDAAAYSARTARLAIADGATTAFRAGAWSDCLTTGWLADPISVDDEAGWPRWLGARAEAWSAQVDVDGGRPYYVRAAAARGSFATFLGVELVAADARPQWRALAVGDSCLLHLRNDTLIRSFPIDDPAAFGYRPPLVHTSSADDPASASGIVRGKGDVRPGDVLLLATDALAEWCLRAGADDSRVWSHLSTIEAPGLERLVEEMRRQGTLGNDDVALLRCRVEWVDLDS